jgi:hypothetical protein
MGSRSKGLHRPGRVTQFQYYRSLGKGPKGESKLARRSRRRYSRSNFSTALASEFAVASAPSRPARRQERQEPLRRAKTPGTSRRNVRLFRQVVRAESRPDGSGPKLRDFVEQWGRLSHRDKGRYRQELIRRAGV